MTATLDCPLIEVSGSPSERGRQYGEQASERIKRGIGHYTEQLQGNGLAQSDLDTIIDKFAAAIESFGPHYIAEMRGIAEGANITLSDVLLLNARTEILKIAKRRQRGERDFIEPDGCTGLIVMPERSADGHLIHAQNWDWKAECAETAVVLKVHRDDGPDILTFTEAGGLARTGFNTAGISLSGNYLETDRDYRSLGVPLSIIRRNALEQQQLALAMRTVYATPKSASNNLIMGHVEGVAIDFECAPDETFLVYPQDGLIVHANHFQSPVALSKLLDRGVGNMPDSLYRDLRVRQLLEGAGDKLTLDAVKTALWDDYQSPWSVCRPPRKSFTNNQTATVAMIVMQPALGTMQVSLLPALNRQFFTYAIDVNASDSASGGGVRNSAA